MKCLFCHQECALGNNSIIKNICNNHAWRVTHFMHEGGYSFANSLSLAGTPTIVIQFFTERNLCNICTSSNYNGLIALNFIPDWSPDDMFLEKKINLLAPFL